MSARRNELTRTAARLFAEKGYHGTSIGDLAEAMGVQKGSLYAHIESKADLLWEVAREGAAAFHAALDSVPDDGPVDRADPGRAARAPAGRGRAARHRDRLRAGVAVPRGRAARGVRRRAPPLRGAVPRALPRGPRARRAAHRPRRRDRGAARALGGELGVHVAASRAATPTSSPTASRRSCSTGCAATRRGEGRARRQSVRDPRRRGRGSREVRAELERVARARRPADRAPGPRDRARHRGLSRAASTRSSSSRGTAASTRR